MFEGIIASTCSNVEAVKRVSQGQGINYYRFHQNLSQILEFLDAVYPRPDVRPDYICIDKGCKVLRTAIVNGSWNVWKETTRFIVDSYHYINHCTNDYLYHKWCNPAPLNGSAPNLVVVEHDVNGNAHYK